MEGLYQTIRHKVYQNLDVGHDITDDELYQVIDRCIYEASREKIISIRQKEELRSRLYNSIKKLDILQELLDDDEITEIMVNGTECIFYEKQGRIKKWDRQFESEEKLADIAQRIAAMSNRMVNEASPIVDTRLNDGSRVNIVLPPVAIDGPVITIRNFYDTPLTIERLIELGSKTTFLNVLSDYIPSDERVITIEDSAELQLHNISNMVRLEARMANAEGGNAVSIRDLIKSSLRMRPDRIVVGEVRGAEALDMLQAMNTGHDGSLSTGHGNSPKDMLTRLETMVLMGMSMPVDAIRTQIASAIDIIVHLARQRDKSRKVVQIAEVGNYQNGEIELTPLFKYVEKGETKDGRILGGLVRQSACIKRTEKLEAAGIRLE